MPWMAIAAGVSIAGSVISGIKGSKAAKGAAQIQSEAANKVAESARATSGSAAADITAAGERAATDVTATGEQAAVDVTSAAEKAGQGAWLSAEEANALLGEIYKGSMSDLDQYKTTGAGALESLRAGTAEGGQFNKTFTAADLEMDPGYQFRMAEGQKALERSAAARGTLLGGGTLKELSRYSQGVASDEFSKAFERARQDRAARFSQFTTLAGIGQRATETGIGAGETYGGRVSSNLTDTARTVGGWDIGAAGAAGDFRAGAAGQAGNFRVGSVNNAGNFRMAGEQIAGNAMIGGANAQAAGTIGAANAWSSALSGIGKTAMDFGTAMTYGKSGVGSVSNSTDSYSGSMNGWVFNKATNSWEKQ